ncbi:sigma-70 family RNA polymerase sigma factor [Colwellia sp. D2M02]|uniref:Sigma-70 family RNA polymerase sigma factor n=1 Tax=Colwellia asteriadis TaxID=517723 RepID=A0ABP3WF76_9GAMM|nr:sigma-70 family RNA polymerase sigma factor [Colwellia sp. D2M02]MBU2893236.1 sigma-70 family RNA polymerase sigma factor [Colwellia sp. D2M02]
MQVAQTRLPSQSTGVTPNSMQNDIQHTELCQWLEAVARSRDKVAFTHLFRFFAPKIQRIAKNKVNTDAQASEVVQETMSNVWKKAHLFNADKGAATTWVYTIMRNVTFDMLRKVQSNKEDNLSEDIWPLVESQSSEEEAFTDHLENKQLLAVIEELPENQKQVVKGFYFMEMSQEQLASHLKLPLGTVKSRLRLALAKLKIQLGESHD